MRAPQVESRPQTAGNELTQNSSRRNRTPDVPHVPQRKDGRQGKQQQRESNKRRHLRIARLGPEPPPPQNEQRRRQQKCCKTKNLEKQIRAKGPGRSNPISRRGVVEGWSTYVKRRIFRVIREQRQRHEYRERDIQKPYQLIEPLISSRRKNAHEVSSAFWGRLSVAAGARRYRAPAWKNFQTH